MTLGLPIWAVGVRYPAPWAVLRIHEIMGLRRTLQPAEKRKHAICLVVPPWQKLPTLM